MMRSLTNHGYEAGDYNFNPLVDFSEFLEEAKKHKKQEHIDLGTQCAQQAQKEQLGEDKKRRHSWKRSIISFLKLPEKKNNLRKEPPASSHPPKASHGGRASASGPLYESGSGASLKARAPRSGPLTSFFYPNKRIENEMPYMCLDKLDNLSSVKSYGPAYLVT